MPVLAGDETCETWLGRDAITAGTYGNLHYRHDGEWLFGTITLVESRCGATGSARPLQGAAEAAYTGYSVDPQAREGQMVVEPAVGAQVMDAPEEPAVQHATTPAAKASQPKKTSKQAGRKQAA